MKEEYAASEKDLPKVYKSAESVQKCTKVYKSAESAVLFGDALALTIFLIPQPNSY